ncbi:MAG: hypothetical protein P4M15_14535 [Alphaproteobacteria bacterium]|nr:hypothetical protein [Alphaproteobacteria bacterium]
MNTTLNVRLPIKIVTNKSDRIAIFATMAFITGTVALLSCYADPILHPGIYFYRIFFGILASTFTFATIYYAIYKTGNYVVEITQSQVTSYKLSKTGKKIDIKNRNMRDFSELSLSEMWASGKYYAELQIFLKFVDKTGVADKDETFPMIGLLDSIGTDCNIPDTDLVTHAEAAANQLSGILQLPLRVSYNGKPKEINNA